LKLKQQLLLACLIFSLQVQLGLITRTEEHLSSFTGEMHQDKTSFDPPNQFIAQKYIAIQPKLENEAVCLLWSPLSVKMMVTIVSQCASQSHFGV
jgi:hypothetical protein